jgi:TonB family protein
LNPNKKGDIDMATGAKRAWTWQEWENHCVDGKFPLLKHLGGSERSAVFLTERPGAEPRKAAIKIIPADPNTAEAYLSRWSESASLYHPHLIQLFEMGSTTLGNVSCAYVVMEYADEDLSRVGRPLEAAEATEMLNATLTGLAYLHEQGLAHGHLKTSNILAVADQLKLSSDTVRPAGEWRKDLDIRELGDPPEIATSGATTAGDIWSLGVTLVNAATMQAPSWDPGAANPTLPENLPAALRAPVSSCLRKDPGQRWTIEELDAFLRRNAGARPVFQPPPSSAKIATSRNLLVAGAIGLLVASAAILPRVLRNSAPPGQPAVKEISPKAAVPTPSANIARQDPGPRAVVNEVLPDVPANARNTIRGKVSIRIRADVDANGNVVAVKNESAESSRFFGNLALQAARRWKFTPGSTQPWILRFEFVRNPKNPVSVQARAAR